jgi:hypothetical protein
LLLLACILTLGWLPFVSLEGGVQKFSGICVVIETLTHCRGVIFYLLPMLCLNCGHISPKLSGCAMPQVLTIQRDELWRGWCVARHVHDFFYDFNQIILPISFAKG